MSVSQLAGVYRPPIEEVLDSLGEAESLREYAFKVGVRSRCFFAGGLPDLLDAYGGGRGVPLHWGWKHKDGADSLAYECALRFDIDGAGGWERVVEALHSLLLGLRSPVLGGLCGDSFVFHSGKKGVHVYVSGRRATALSLPERKNLVNYLVSVGNQELRDCLDVAVTTGTGHFIKFPYMVHPDTGNVCVCIRERAQSFAPVPLCEGLLCDVLSAYPVTPYIF